MNGTEPEFYSAIYEGHANEASCEEGVSAIEFHNVSFKYPNASAWQLQQVNFKVRPGEKLAIVGASGSGKSTALKLMTRLHDATHGSVVINGQDVRKMPLAEVRRAIGVVSQDSLLFDNTVAYNIRYGAPKASEKDVIEAARAAQVHDAVMRQPAGYETRVGERGAKLSGGERQRVAIARTLLRQPGILLFDEVTSAVDAETEILITEALRRVNEGRTSVTVAHRLQSIRHCDRIIVMSQGRVVEEGTHEALMAMGANGLYRKLWNLQHNVPSAPVSQ